MGTRLWLSELKQIDTHGVNAVIDWYKNTDEVECKLTEINPKFYIYAKNLIEFYKNERTTKCIIEAYTSRGDSPYPYENPHSDFVIFRLFRKFEEQDEETEKELKWEDICKTNRFYKRFIEEGIEEGIDDESFKPILIKLITVCYNDLFLCERILEPESLSRYLEKLTAIKDSKATYEEKKIAYNKLYERYILEQLNIWLKLGTDRINPNKPTSEEQLFNFIETKAVDEILNFLLNYPFLNIYSTDKIIKLRKKFFYSFKEPLDKIKEKDYRIVKYLYIIFETIHTLKQREDIEDDDDAYDHFDNQTYTFSPFSYGPKRIFYTYDFRHTIKNSNFKDNISMKQWANIDMILQFYKSDTIGSIISELNESSEDPSSIYENFMKEHPFGIEANEKDLSIVLKEYKKGMTVYDNKGRKGEVVAYDEQDEKMMYHVQLEGNDKIRILDQEEITKDAPAPIRESVEPQVEENENVSEQPESPLSRSATPATPDPSRNNSNSQTVKKPDQIPEQPTALAPEEVPSRSQSRGRANSRESSQEKPFQIPEQLTAIVSKEVSSRSQSRGRANSRESLEEERVEYPPVPALLKPIINKLKGTNPSDDKIKQEVLAKGIKEVTNKPGEPNRADKAVLLIKRELGI